MTSEITAHCMQGTYRGHPPLEPLAESQLWTSCPHLFFQHMAQGAPSFLVDPPTRGAGRGWCTGQLRSSQSLWSTRKCLCGRTLVSGWKHCADGGCWAILAQDRGSITNQHQCPCCRRMHSSGSPERLSMGFGPVFYVFTCQLASDKQQVWDFGIRTTLHASQRRC